MRKMYLNKKIISFVMCTAVIMTLCGCEGNSSYENGYEKGYEDGLEHAAENAYDYIDAEEIVREKWYDYVSYEDVREHFSDEIYEDIAAGNYDDFINDRAVEWGMMLGEDIGYDLIESKEYSALDTLRELYGDEEILGSYVLDKTTNTVHATDGGCSERIKSSNIGEVILFYEMQNGCNLCECVHQEDISYALQRIEE